MPRKLMIAAATLAGTMALLFSGGCASTDDGGDMPWATPASWEGSPFIPGLSE